MILFFTLLFGVVTYLFYNSKDEVSLVEGDQLDKQNERIEDDNLYKDLEDLFI